MPATAPTWLRTALSSKLSGPATSEPSGVIQEGAEDMFFIVEVTSGETDPRARDLDEVRPCVTDWKLVEAIKAARTEAEAIGPSAFDSDERPLPFAAPAQALSMRRHG